MPDARRADMKQEKGKQRHGQTGKNVPASPAPCHIRLFRDLTRVRRQATRACCNRIRRDYPAGFCASEQDGSMSRRCELSGTGPLSGNNVSHANNRTKRRFLPNLCAVSLYSDRLRETFRLRVCASTLRTVDHAGGLDAYLEKADRTQLSPNALKIRRKLDSTLREEGTPEKGR